MSESIVIAEISKNSVAPVTAELVSAAMALGTSPTVIVPCTDASVASGVGFANAGKVIAVKGDCFANYDAASWAQAIDSAAPSGIIITSASPQSKDLAARIAARRNLSVVQDVVAISGNNLTSPIYSGKAMQTVALSGDAVISVRSNVFAADAAGRTGRRRATLAADEACRRVGCPRSSHTHAPHVAAPTRRDESTSAASIGCATPAAVAATAAAAASATTSVECGCGPGRSASTPPAACSRTEWF